VKQHEYMTITFDGLDDSLKFVWNCVICCAKILRLEFGVFNYFFCST